MEKGYTYILENQNVPKKGQGTRRYYIGFTRDLDRRMQEHTKDRRKNYKLMWYIEGNYEYKFKKFGATKFVELIKLDLIKGGIKTW